MRPYRKAVSIIVRNKVGEILVVKRPDDPEDDLSGFWGFPAVTLRSGETNPEAAKRAARTKLGVEVGIVRKIGENIYDKSRYRLHLVDYEVSLRHGTPHVPQPDQTVTQYTACRFTADLTILIPSPEQSSKHSRIFIDALRFWRVVSALE